MNGPKVPEKASYFLLTWWFGHVYSPPVAWLVACLAPSRLCSAAKLSESLAPAPVGIALHRTHSIASVTRDMP